jgi:hypothetical protein
MHEKISLQISWQNMSIWRYNFQISEESSNTPHFDRKLLKRNQNKSCFNWGKSWWHQSSIRKFSSKTFGQLAWQSNVSVGSAWTATKLLHICQYKITVVPEIKPVDYEKRARFCNWFIDHMHDGLPDRKLTFFTDEASFNLSGYVNSQNNR